MNRNHQTLFGAMIAILLGMTFPSCMNAQETFEFWWTERYARQNAEQMQLRTRQMLDTSKDRLTTLPLSKLLDDDDDRVWWWDGQTAYRLGYTDNDRNRILVSAGEDGSTVYTLLCQKKKGGVTVSVKNHQGWSVAYQSVGPWTLLVFRDAKQRVVDCYIKVMQHNLLDKPDVQTLTMHDLFDGVYQTDKGKKAVLGPVLDHYEDIGYSCDPGIFSVRPEEWGTLTGIIQFGDGRVNHGDPSSPKYGLMPGGGGAGALMGPMVWEVTPIPLGLHVKIVNDEPFVDHNPRFEDSEFDLQRIQDAYPDLPGIYSVASVRPLPKGMLRLLPKGDLMLMNNEIPARHTDFHQLTDIELMNLDLIQEVLAEKE